MIEAKNLTKRYGHTLAVDNLNFRIERGQIVGFLGPNGAGKSTTLRILTGYLPATSGAVTVDGHDVLTQSLAVRSKVGYLPENTPLYPEMRVEEYLDYRGRLQKMDRPTRRKRIGVVCDRCGLLAVRRRLIGQLSRGNKQRVGLAQALLHDPPVLILDEPTAGLDPNQIGHVRQLIGELRDQHTILLSTHILPEVEKVADNIMIIANGRIVAQGSPQQLRRTVEPHWRVWVQVQADAQAVADTLAQVQGVKQVQTTHEDGWCRAAVTTQEGVDVRATLGDAIMAKRWLIRELRQEEASLEQMFVRITALQDQSSGEPAP